VSETQTPLNRRSTDALEEALKAINANIARLQTSLDSVIPAVNRIALIEERHVEAGRAIERSFTEIEKVRGEVEELAGSVETNKREDDKAHGRYNIYFAFVYGVCATAGLVGGFVGKDIVDAVRDTIKQTERLGFRVEVLEHQPHQKQP